MNEPTFAGDPALLRFDIFTLFPGMIAGPLDESILKRARATGLIHIAIHDIREWTTDRHRTVDDRPYGGGAGMVMMAPPVVDSVESVLGGAIGATRVLVMSAAGRQFDQAMAQELSETGRIAIICGHYEGIDERVMDILTCDEVSIGDYVLTGGELPALVIVDAVMRLVPGVIDEASTADESHASELLEYPHYTRPPVFRGLAVPDVLLSGHHAEIERWRRSQAERRTRERRPDLLPPSNDNPLD